MAIVPSNRCVFECWSLGEYVWANESKISKWFICGQYSVVLSNPWDQMHAYWLNCVLGRCLNQKDSTWSWPHLKPPMMHSELFIPSHLQLLKDWIGTSECGSGCLLRFWLHGQRFQHLYKKSERYSMDDAILQCGITLASHMYFSLWSNWTIRKWIYENARIKFIYLFLGLKFELEKGVFNNFLNIRILLNENMFNYISNTLFFFFLFVLFLNSRQT